MTRSIHGLGFALVLLTAHCGPNQSTDAGSDAGNDVRTGDGALDSAMDGSTTDDVTAMDGTSTTDTPIADDTPAPTDGNAADTAVTDATPNDASPACAGMECGGYATVLASAARGATSIDNCVVQLHRSDCCGATRAYGINHGSRASLCAAETSCVATYPSNPGCTDATITTDTGETTTTMNDVKIRLVNPMPCSFDPTQTCSTCETFVCTQASCRSMPGIAGGCG